MLISRKPPTIFHPSVQIRSSDNTPNQFDNDNHKTTATVGLLPPLSLDSQLMIHHLITATPLTGCLFSSYSPILLANFVAGFVPLKPSDANSSISQQESSGETQLSQEIPKKERARIRVSEAIPGSYWSVLSRSTGKDMVVIQSKKLRCGRDMGEVGCRSAIGNVFLRPAVDTNNLSLSIKPQERDFKPQKEGQR